MTNTMNAGCTHQPIPPFAQKKRKKNAKMNDDYVCHLAPFQTATNSALFQPPAVNDKHKSNDEYTHWPIPPSAQKQQ